MMSRQFDEVYTACCSPSSGEDANDISDAHEEPELSSLTSQLIPTSSEVKSLVRDICETSVAEFELKMSGFRLYVARDVTMEHADPCTTSFASAPLYRTNSEAPDTNGSLSKPSLSISKPVRFSDGKQNILDKAAYEGLVILKSPRVGFLRRCRTIKGKRAPPACKEKQIVKEGQVLCYIEQLGGEIPIESDIAGEIVTILRKDGDPVGYGDALISMLPSFPGIKNLQ